jgi:succinate-semialdehyde dehydrogenase/glutarate-semialdehyde dehydrogenase
VGETKNAIDAAKEAFTIWSGFTAGKRARILKKWHQLQLSNVDDLAIILTTEQGKPLLEAKGEIKYGASYVEWFAEEARRVYGDTIPGQSRSNRITIIKQAVGVVGAITPWNFPSAMITRKLSPALAAGCTVVLKPSELTPLSALALGQLAIEAGFPPGVINIIPTMHAPAVGLEMTTNKIVKKISFTGSTEVGKILLKQSADTVKKVSLELGGNAPFIVFEDAVIDNAVKGLMISKFRNAGQTCVCSNRIFVHASVYEEFTNKLSNAVLGLKLGSGLDAETNIGPLVEEKAVAFVDAIVKDSIDKGGEVVSGGKIFKEKGLIYEPTIIKNANVKMRLFKEEIFGPVAPIFKFEEEAEVIAMANDTNYGLAAYFYGTDYARIWRVAEALEYGMVGINTGVMSTPTAPFGGVKESGIGREGSKYGIDDYLNIKYMCWAGI